MAFGDQYSQTPVGQHLLLIAATPGDALAYGLASEFQRLGWTPIVTDQVERYAAEAQACIVLMSPMSLQSPAVISALSARPANLIPLITMPMSPPYAPWATPPFTFAGSTGQTSASINKALVALLGPAAPMQSPAPYQAGYPASYPASYPTYPGYGGQAPDTVALPARRGRWPLLFAAIGGVALLACVIVSLFALHAAQASVGKAAVSAQATATPTPRATPTLASGFSRFTDPAGNYQINQPKSWTQSMASGDSVWVNPAKVADIVIGQVAGNATNADITVAEASSFKQFSTGAGGDGSYNNFQGPTSVSMAGETWTQESADIPFHGITMHGVLIASVHHQRLYIIGRFAPKNSFASLDAQTFQPMVRSFYFLT